jgi:fumarylacetoacetase
MLKSWLPVSPGSDFSLANIPFGIISRKTIYKRVPATRIGNYILDLSTFSEQGGFESLPSVQQQLHVFHESTLNAFAALGQATHREVRSFLQNVLSEDTSHPEILRDNEARREQCLLAMHKVHNYLPMDIGDFSDFYGGINHAVNAGALFRGQKGALLPNYLHLPMAYHGRSSSIVVSGTSLKRPWGQCVRDPDADPKVPEFDICRTMDFELELGAFICKENRAGERITVDDARSCIFGYVLLNDWSARDIQRWEYVPLGPFNGKNFATTISAWIVLADALEPYRARGVQNTQTLLPYLQETRCDSVYDLHLEVILTSGKTGNCTTICRNNAPTGLVWSFQQMLAHHTITGCPMRVGDLLGSGTISGLTNDSLGCLLEQTLNGKDPINIEDGEQRTWLEDGDSVTLRGYAGNAESGRVGFGDCCGQLLAADDIDTTKQR